MKITTGLPLTSMQLALTTAAVQTFTNPSNATNGAFETAEIIRRADTSGLISKIILPATSEHPLRAKAQRFLRREKRFGEESVRSYGNAFKIDGVFPFSNTSNTTAATSHNDFRMLPLNGFRFISNPPFVATEVSRALLNKNVLLAVELINARYTAEKDFAGEARFALQSIRESLASLELPDGVTPEDVWDKLEELTAQF